MTTETIFRRSIAVAQTRTHDQAPQGYNYSVVVACVSTKDTAHGLARVLKQLDHKSLGVDLKLDVEASTTNLAKWIFQALHREAVDVRQVELVRGDGLSVRYWQP